MYVIRYRLLLPQVCDLFVVGQKVPRLERFREVWCGRQVNCNTFLVYAFCSTTIFNVTRERGKLSFTLSSQIVCHILGRTYWAVYAGGAQVENVLRTMCLKNVFLFSCCQTSPYGLSSILPHRGGPSLLIGCH